MRGQPNPYGTVDISGFTDDDWIKFLTEVISIGGAFDNIHNRKKLAFHQHRKAFGGQPRK